MPEYNDDMGSLKHNLNELREDIFDIRNSIKSETDGGSCNPKLVNLCLRLLVENGLNRAICAADSLEIKWRQLVEENQDLNDAAERKDKRIEEMENQLNAEHPEFTKTPIPEINSEHVLSYEELVQMRMDQITNNTKWKLPTIIAVRRRIGHNNINTKDAKDLVEKTWGALLIQAFSPKLVALEGSQSKNVEDRVRAFEGLENEANRRIRFQEQASA